MTHRWVWRTIRFEGESFMYKACEICGKVLF